jgi:hypothetical protein
MKSAILLAVLSVLGASACDLPNSGDLPDAGTSGAATSNTENAKKNEHDRLSPAFAPSTPGESEADRAITQQIQKVWSPSGGR